MAIRDGIGGTTGSSTGKCVPPPMCLFVATQMTTTTRRPTTTTTTTQTTTTLKTKTFSMFNAMFNPTKNPLNSSGHQKNEIQSFSSPKKISTTMSTKFQYSATSSNFDQIKEPFDETTTSSHTMEIIQTSKIRYEKMESHTSKSIKKTDWLSNGESLFLREWNL